MPRPVDILTHCPIVKEETAVFGRRIELSGSPLDIYGSVTFQATIQWLRKSVTEVRVLAYDGTVLKAQENASDVYGLLHSLASAPYLHAHFSNLYSASPVSMIAVETFVIVQDHPVIRFGEDHGIPVYRPIPDDWRYADDPGFLAAGMPGYDHPRSDWITPKTVAKGVVETSRVHGDMDTAKRLDRLVTEALADLPIDQVRTILRSLEDARAREKSYRTDD
jgi:hypothetical protein